ncbi:PhzF family phenazine biosynthesis protein [Novosphingobium sp.]|uniref:PhzF family phenazine biosynthesis protein n=1 Tax=Novosphingobium sp. TaxID=1874826 RepID=UPI0025D88A2C|nr:PhzF family phenazine biosynthesis protein [Novosphingobium sp.]
MDRSSNDPSPFSIDRRGAMLGAPVAGMAMLSASPVRGQTTPADFAFHQVDVFSPEPFRGNPLAVVLGADRLGDAQMALFSKWTNLSETTFLLRPTDPAADYRVRIFSVGEELPFAGHPTLGSCHVWLATGGRPRGAEIVQQCPAGLVHLRGAPGRLAFEAPPLKRVQPLDAALLDRLRRGLGLGEGEIVASGLLDSGLPQTALMIRSRERLLALKPDWRVLETDFVGLIAPYGAQHRPGEPDFEVRVFDETLANSEDPVTGSFNAAVARWLIGSGQAPAHYLVSQGTVLGRAGRVHVDQDAGRVWIGGDVTERIIGRVRF